MKPEQTVALCVRLFAIALAFSALRLVSAWAPYIGAEDMGLSQVIGVFLTLLIVTFVVLLWIFPSFVARRIVPVSAAETPKRTWAVDELYGCGFVLLGAYFLFHGLSDGIYWVGYLIALARNQLGLIRHTYQETLSIIVTAIEILASIAIILGARGITKLVFKLRYVGVE